MYQPKDKSYAIIAVCYYILQMIGLFVAGIMFQKGIRSVMYIIVCSVFILGVLIVLVKDKSIKNLGFSREKAKRNLIISAIIVVVTFLISWIFGDLPVHILIQHTLYQLFFIATAEEIQFRGFIQNYLFGLKANKYLVFALGALFFSFSHIPFQMFVHDNVSMSYLIQAMPQLASTFISHLVFCFITHKSKDILIPIALHYAWNFLG